MQNDLIKENVFESAAFGRIRTLVETVDAAAHNGPLLAEIERLQGQLIRETDADMIDTMMDRLIVLKKQERSQRGDCYEWFVAQDICRALGFKNHSAAVRTHVHRGDIAKRDVCDANHHRQKMLVVNESGLYALVFGSKLETAQDFKRYVTAVILPSIRRHGAFMTSEALERVKNDPEAARALVDALESERARCSALAGQVFMLETALEALKPKARFAEAVIRSEGAVSMGDMAKLLQKMGVDTGRTRLFAALRQKGILSTQKGSWNKPMQWTVERGYFEIEEGSFKKPLGDEERLLWSVTRVTPKGQAYLFGIFGGADELSD